MELSSNNLSTIPTFIFFLTLLFFSSTSALPSSNNSNLFRTYIGAEFLNVTFSDLPIHPEVEFHFILSFAIDYTDLSSPSPTNGNFSVFWDTDNLTPNDVLNIKKNHPNVKVALSLGGDSVNNNSAYFAPHSIDSWVSNAVSSLTNIVEKYNLDGIDIDYEHFLTNNHSKGDFVECIGKLITTLKNKRVISFASIAPYDDGGLVKRHYTALWRKYGGVIDYVNFQFYAYDKGTSVDQFMAYFDEQSGVYKGGRILVSYISDGSGGLGPGDGFFIGCRRLKRKGQLHGIFVWCADESKRLGFKYEEESQRVLADVSHH